MRALVTGGAGFIGSHLADALSTSGDVVAVVDDLSAGFRERLDCSTELYEADVRNSAAMRHTVAQVRPDVVFHLAAQADIRVSSSDPRTDAAVNILGTINVLQAALDVGARVVFASSGGAIYGEAPTPVSESATPSPLSPYGVAKLCAEEYCRFFALAHRLPTAVLRLANVYGPRQDPHAEGGVVSIFAGLVARGEAPTIFGDGRQTRDYVYVGDVVRAFRLAAAIPRSGVWNVGTGRATSTLELLERIADAANKRVSPRFARSRAGEIAASVLATDAAERDLSFTTQVPLREGVARVVAWIAGGESVRAPA